MRKTTAFFILTSMVLFFLHTSPAHAEYNPTTGRFLQRDPIGVQDSICIMEFYTNGSPGFSNIREFYPFDQYSEGMNIYHYVNSSPNNKIDTFGLLGKDKCQHDSFSVEGCVAVPSTVSCSQLVDVKKAMEMLKPWQLIPDIDTAVKAALLGKAAIIGFKTTFCGCSFCCIVRKWECKKNWHGAKREYEQKPEWRRARKRKLSKDTIDMSDIYECSKSGAAQARTDLGYKIHSEEIPYVHVNR